MPETPRNLLVRNRPLRKALLVDQDAWPSGDQKTDVLLDDFVRAAQGRWEGLGSPIILYHGGALSAPDRELLQLADPDRILAVKDLPQDLLLELDRDLAPTQIDIARVDESRTRYEISGLTIPFSQEVVANFGGRSPLVFDFHSSCEPVVRRFLDRNFGSFEQWSDPRNSAVIRRLGGIEHCLSQTAHLPEAISDRHSLAAFLNRVAGSRPAKGQSFVSPRSCFALCEIGGRPNPHGMLGRLLDRTYLVCVGDLPEDFVAHWNTALWSRNLEAPYKNQLWIPAELAKDPSLHDSLNNWLRYHSRFGNTTAKGIAFASETLTLEQLQPIAEAICHASTHRLPCSVLTREQLAEHRADELRDLRHQPRMSGKEPDAYRRILHGNRGVVDVPFPTPFGIEKPEGIWMVDVQVEQLTPGIGGQDPFRPWLLPRRASRLAQRIFKEAARINRSGLFSVELGYSSVPFGRRGKPELAFNLPEESQVLFSVLSAEEANWHITSDPRAKLPDTLFPRFYLSASDKGQMMRGMLGLFDGLVAADHFLSRPYWQRLFRELANLDPKRNATLITSIRNVLAKGLRQEKVAADRLDHLARRVAAYAAGRTAGQHRTLAHCEKLRADLANLEKKTDTFAAGDAQLQVLKMGLFSEEDMHREFQALTAKKILRLGTVLSCPNCSVANWYGIDSLKETLACPGCDAEITLPFNYGTSVTLNSLARMAVVQGVLGVLQAASTLAGNSESFFFAPSFEIRRGWASDAWHEVDLAAILNGELIIAEVKEGDLNSNDFESLVEVAEVFKAAKAIFFFRKEAWSRNMDEPLKQAHARLAAKGITLEVHHLVIV